jgi:hypothetical protein
MPKKIEITVPPEQTASLVDHVRHAEGIISLKLQSGGSLQPPGDIVTVILTNRSLYSFLGVMDRLKIGASPAHSVTFTEPTSVLSVDVAEDIATDTSWTAWEEMELVMGKESNMTTSALIVMVISGVMAATGIVTGALHVVIGAMLIAPGFEPIIRIPFGLIVRSPGAGRRGVLYTFQGYLALIIGAAATAFAFRVAGQPLGGETYLPSHSLISYWTTITFPSLLVSAVASVAGALLVASKREVLTGGVMIGLALIPTAALIGVAGVAGDWGVAGRAVFRWVVEVGVVLLFSATVFAWIRLRLQKRDSLL